ncbi:hypothetical protein F3Y22_tig00111298pilonHSYRG00082 [Hibiscus syriacus]|uniref:Uncharacterized protein n=1 Tax=Hibiscus syriacus TaxID=106335 RepID=A0A6A2YRD4_HIBSY|nr:hypothetical protein F3Y22_tig00111298pilonHSYRG00082 [Hibiscus syriacus]
MEQEQPLKQKQQEGEPVHLLNQLRKRLILKKEKKRTLLEKLGSLEKLGFGSKKAKPVGLRTSVSAGHSSWENYGYHGSWWTTRRGLDELIDDAGDVKLLRDHGLFHDVLGSDEEVAKLFNTMSTVLVPSPEIYLDLKLQIEDHCRKKWIRHAAQAYLAYFSSPWTILAFLGANAALLMSALQTYYAIISAK